MSEGQRITTEQMGPVGVSNSYEADRVGNEKSKSYWEKVGQYRRRVERLRDEIAKLAVENDKNVDVDSIIAKFDSGEINYDAFLLKKEIIFDY